MLFYHQQLQSALRAESRELSQPVRKFAGTEAVYAGEEDGLLDAQCWEAYLDALDAVRRWLRIASLLDLSESLRTETHTLLYLPGEDLQVDVCVEAEVCMPVRNVPGVLFPAQGAGSEVMRRQWERPACFHRGSYEGISTPIGRMDSFLYRCLVEVRENPVSLIYRHFARLLEKTRGMLRAQGAPDGVMEEGLLADYGIHDVIGVYRLDSSLAGVDRFLDGRGAQSFPGCSGSVQG